MYDTDVVYFREECLELEEEEEGAGIVLALTVIN